MTLRLLVQSHNFPLAYYCAKQHQSRDPENLDALLVMARAAQELGQMELANQLATDARTRELTTAQRFAAYLISGMAQASLSNLTSAKILLYRASDFARADAEHRVLRRSLSQLNGLSPWKFSAGVNITPSTNINSGSLHDTIQIAGLEFELDEDAKAQSGIRYSSSVGVTHQTRLSSSTIWKNQTTASGTAYDGRGRSEAQFTLKSGLRYTPRRAIPSLFYGFVSYDNRYIAQTIGGPALGEYMPYFAQLTYGLEYHQQPKPTSAWKVFATYTNRTSDTFPAKDARIGTVGGSYTFALNDNVVLAVSGFAKDTQAASADGAYSAGNLSAAVKWTLDTLPVTLSGNIGITHKEYKHLLFGYSDLRSDDVTTLELTLTHNDIQYYGFNPTFGVALTRNYSNMNRFDTQTVDVFTRLSTSF